MAVNRIVRWLLQRRSVVSISIGVLVALLLSAAYLYGLGFLAVWQRSLADLLFLGRTPSERVVVVAIDEQSLEEVGRWPWTRETQGELIRASGSQAAALGLDIALTERSTPALDGAFVSAIESVPRLALVTMLQLPEDQRSDGTIVAPSQELPLPEFVAAADAVAHVNVLPDPDGIVRTLPVSVQGPDGLVDALSITLLGMADPAYRLVRPESPGVWPSVQAGPRAIPLEPGGRMRINYAGGRGVFETVSAADVIAGRVKPDHFSGRIVLIGVTAKALGDYYMTPPSEGVPVPGVEIHANAIDAVLQGRFLVPQTRVAAVGLLLVLGLVCGVAFSRLRAGSSLLVAAGLTVAVILLALFRFERGVIDNLVYPPLVIVFAYSGVFTFRTVVEGAERRRVQGLFGRYVKPEVVEQILGAADDDVERLKGVEQTVTVMFGDIRGFTSISEKHTPREVVDMLNHYLDYMTQILFKYDGTLDKYIGDAIMAFFNAPHEQPDHALLAVKSALDMQTTMLEFEQRNDLGDLPLVCYGIGIHTGEAVVGNMGSALRYDYTVIGDTVNLASRLCGIAEAGQVLITHATYELVKDDVIAVELEPVHVKGKEQIIRVFNVTGLREESGL